MSMYAPRLSMLSVGIAAVLAVCVALPGMTWAAKSTLLENSVRQVDEISEPIDILNPKTQDFSRLVRTKPCDVPFSSAERFVEVLNGEAYCDQTTGLVWERFPARGFFNWAGAVNHCATLQLGGWKGWSLPMREQLASLLDINSILCRGGGLCLPDNHPFQNLQSGGYWSASTTAGTPTFAWLVNFFLGSALVKNFGANGLAWCIRDSQSADGQDLTAMELSPYHY